MRKGEIPVPYIVALILAVIVIAILGIWFFKSSGDTNTALNEQKCRAKLMAECVGKADDYNLNPYDYAECKNTDVAKGVRTCADL
ncbi:MAG: hypothetical protein A2Y81_05635 [Nitrospirae bacterium RBG_13_43_8]|nr:MAG: hypothetical protein A2Y81_05635 [Nitrospirae bacterium RBG_13_43_8]